MGKYPNSGILSRVTDRKSDKNPEFSGSAEIDGVEYWMSAYVNEGEKGKYFKISFKPKEQQHATSFGNPKRSQQQEEDKDIPF